MAYTRVPHRALQRAIEAYGSQSEMARRRGVAQPTVNDWLHRMKRLPAEHVLGVEADTGVSRHDLRPDLYPRDLPPAPGEAPASASTADAGDPGGRSALHGMRA
jgi:DNA-binding transcriptional regulator YdaS (Cro superfamily)